MACGSKRYLKVIIRRCRRWINIVVVVLRELEDRFSLMSVRLHLICVYVCIFVLLAHLICL